MHPISQDAKRSVQSLEQDGRDHTRRSVEGEVCRLAAVGGEGLISNVSTGEVLIDRPPWSHTQRIGECIGDILAPGRKRQQLSYKVGALGR